MRTITQHWHEFKFIQILIQYIQIIITGKLTLQIHGNGHSRSELQSVSHCLSVTVTETVIQSHRHTQSIT
jgi:hypothetical protein